MFQRERMLNHEKIIKNIYLYENLRCKVWFFFFLHDVMKYPVFFWMASLTLLVTQGCGKRRWISKSKSCFHLRTWTINGCFARAKKFTNILQGRSSIAKIGDEFTSRVLFVQTQFTAFQNSFNPRERLNQIVIMVVTGWVVSLTIDRRISWTNSLNHCGKWKYQEDSPIHRI